MTSFFPAVPQRGFAAEDDDHLPRLEDPPWTGPAWHQRPVIVALNAEIARSESTAAFLESAGCFPYGLSLRLVLRVRDSGRQARNRVFSYLERAHGRGQLDERLRAGGLRWGVEFDDARKVTTLDESPWARVQDIRSDQVEGPVMEGLGPPAAFMDRWARDYWLWPLPPAGSIRVGLQWLDRGIPETVTGVAVAPLLAAAAKAGPLWPVPSGDPPPARHGFGG